MDDGFALAAILCAAASGRVDLLGVSTVHGNTSSRGAESCARRLAQAAGRDVAVWRGAEAPGGRGEASDRLARLPDGVEILALGPLSNIAAALDADPGLCARAALRVVGGSLSSRGFLPPIWPYEFNFARDRPAARRVLSAPWRSLVVYPLDVVSRMRIDAGRLYSICALSPLGAYLVEGSRRWLRRARWRHLSGSFPVWDLPAALNAAGLLSPLVERRRSRGANRSYFGNTSEPAWVIRFDSDKAWAGFEHLLLAPNPPAL